MKVRVYAMRRLDAASVWAVVRRAQDEAGARLYWSATIEADHLLSSLLFDEPADVLWGGRPVKALDLEIDADIPAGLESVLRLYGRGKATIVPGRLLAADDLDGLFVRWKDDGDEHCSESLAILFQSLTGLLERNVELRGPADHLALVLFREAEGSK